MSSQKFKGFRNNLSDAFSGLLPTFEAAAADPRDEVIVRYTRGTGKFSPDKKYIALNMKMYKLSGEEDGSHQGVWHALFDNPQMLARVPEPPEPTMDQPKGPVPALAPLAETKAIWTFGDGSSISAVGPAESHLIQLTDGSYVFMVTCAQVITNGTGRYDGCAGLKQSLGATHIPAGVNLFGPKTVSFEATTVDTFRVVRKRYYRNPFSSPPGPQPSDNVPQGGGDDQDDGSSDQEGISPEYPFKTKKIEVRKSRMSYIDEGSGNPILFLHGNPTWSYLWRNIIQGLTSVGRCVAPDLIGMGRSDKPEIDYSFEEHYEYLRSFIRKLELDRITLVLHDWGSALGFYWASCHPEKVKGLVFMEAMVKPYPTWEDFPARNAPQQLRDVFKAYRSEQGYDLIVKQNKFMEQTFQLAGRPLSRKEKDFYQEPFHTEHSREVILEWARQIPIAGDPPDVTEKVTHYSDFLQETDKPKLLLYTEPGAILLKEQLDWCDENLIRLKKVNLDPQNRQVPIHLLQEKYPQKIVDAITNWYRQYCSGAE
ncbi:MAG TPA: haloalkane dehalogenase [Candidatus Angelobacter sp.]|jgi:haloalkane dehalogenase|nr:haloalkane dehalogenase [Candidatus Angelobacter sp.]